jgi:hypothetical protein
MIPTISGANTANAFEGVAEYDATPELLEKFLWIG